MRIGVLAAALLAFAACDSASPAREVPPMPKLQAAPSTAPVAKIETATFALG